MIWVRMGMVKIGWPAASSSAMIWSRTLRVMSSSVLASRTTNSVPSSTSRRTSSRVMYLLVAVSYRRRLGYFLSTRGSLIGLPGPGAAEASHHVLAAVARHDFLADLLQPTEYHLRGNIPRRGPVAPHAFRPPVIPSEARDLPREHRGSPSR